MAQFAGVAGSVATESALIQCRQVGRLTKVMRVLRGNPSGALGLVLVMLYFAIVLASPALAPYPYDKMAVGPILSGPSRAYLFGTDEFGRDVFSRVILGSPISLRVGLIVVLTSGTVGSILGLVSGFYGGWIDEIVMRVTDIFLSLPTLVLALTIAASLGGGIQSAIIGVALVRWTAYARLMRSCVLVERGEEYVLAARAIGASSVRIIGRHILPNSVGAPLVQATMDFGMAILTAAGLSFIGAGAQPPLPEWGALVASGRQYMLNAWWIASFPGLAILVVVLGFNLLGDMLRDALDPCLRSCLGSE